MIDYESIPVMDHVDGNDVLQFEKTLKTMTDYKSIDLSDNEVRRILRRTSCKMRQRIDMEPLDVNYNPYLIHHVLGIDEIRNRLVVMRIRKHSNVTDFTEVRDATEHDMKEYTLVNEEFCRIT